MPSLQIESDYQPAYDAWKADPNPANSTQLLNTVRPVINTAVRIYAGPSAKSPTIRSQAKKLALEAMDTYDPSRGTIKTHLMSTLQRLRRVAARQRQIISLPEQVALDQMETARATAELEDRFNRPPSDAELADYTGLSQKRIGYIRGSMRPTAEGTITRMKDEGGGYDPSVKRLYDEDDAWVELVYDDSDPTDQYIMERVLGLHGHTPQNPSSVASALKISPAAVSHRMARLQQKLDMREQIGIL
jgi:hypothetical protein